MSSLSHGKMQEERIFNQGGCNRMAFSPVERNTVMGVVPIAVPIVGAKGDQQIRGYRSAIVSEGPLTVLN